MPVTMHEFRRMALALPETEERAHMNHLDFRVRGKIFATLGYPDKGWGMVRLTPVEQALFIEAELKVYAPAKGAWGRGGATCVRLAAAKKTSLRRAMTAAWDLSAGADKRQRRVTKRRFPISARGC